jgi:hypothetical protein
MSEDKQSQGSQKRLAMLRNAFRPKSRNSPPGVKSQVKRITSSDVSSSTASSQTIGSQRIDPSNVSGDRKRTEKRYEKAIQQLEASLRLKFRGANWQPFEIPTFNDIIEKDPFPQIRMDVEKMLDTREESIKDRSFWSKSKNIMGNIFTSTSPIAKNLLTIAKEGSSVYIALIRTDESRWFH